MNQENTTTHYLYGMHPVMEALMAGRKIEKILFKQGLEGDRFRQLLEMAQAQEIPVQFVPRKNLQNPDCSIKISS